MTTGDVAPYVRGCAWPAGAGVAYPRADPTDFARLPIDTWGTAQIPATVRLELAGDADAVELTYRTETADLGYRGPGAGTTFALWRDGSCVDEVPAQLGEGRVRLAFGAGATSDVPATVYLPEGMKPTVLSIEARGGSIEPAPRGPRWVAYGDSILEGWLASGPAGAWPAIAARTHGLDVVNLGYAGSARGEIVSAEHIAGIPADVISISHGTNCWTRTPHSVEQILANTTAFLDVVREGHPETPVVVCTPVLRPDAEENPNRLGATLRDLREAIERAARRRDDDRLTVVDGDGLLTAELLPDGIHPGDEGHEILAREFGAAVAGALA
ncbi:MAG TPA: GDSL-type esterase/lipase family protein [Acidimicrobiia bacterium]